MAYLFRGENGIAFALRRQQRMASPQLERRHDYFPFPQKLKHTYTHRHISRHRFANLSVQHRNVVTTILQSAVCRRRRRRPLATSIYVPVIPNCCQCFWPNAYDLSRYSNSFTKYCITFTRATSLAHLIKVRHYICWLTFNAQAACNIRHAVRTSLPLLRLLAVARPPAVLSL